MILKNRLKELRARDGFNQSELAKLAGVSRQSISLLERGEYTPLTLEEGVEWSADALEVFQEKEIPVIRLGLSPSRELEEQALAGVYHPALGQLVQSRILRRRCEEVLRHAPPGPVTLYYKKGQRSTLQGQKNENLRYFKEHYPDKIITLKEVR